VRSRGSGRLQTGSVGASTQLEASPTFCAARFANPSNGTLFWFGYTFGRVASLGSRPNCGHGWQVTRLSGNHFLGAKKGDDANNKSSPGAQSSRGLHTLHGFARDRYNLTQAHDEFPRRRRLLRPGPLAGIYRRLAVREGNSETRQNETGELELDGQHHRQANVSDTGGSRLACAREGSPALSWPQRGKAGWGYPRNRSRAFQYTSLK
jgi:hypothetical protein